MEERRPRRHALGRLDGAQTTRWVFTSAGTSNKWIDVLENIIVVGIVGGVSSSEARTREKKEPKERNHGKERLGSERLGERKK